MYYLYKMLDVHNLLKLNDSKTEFVVMGMRQQLRFGR